MSIPSNVRRTVPTKGVRIPPPSIFLAEASGSEIIKLSEIAGRPSATMVNMINKQTQTTIKTETQE